MVVPRLCALFVLVTGCNKLVVPPSRIALGTGVMSNERAKPGDKTADAALDLRWTVHPLALDPASRNRRFDAGMGYSATWGPHTVHGPELLCEYFLLQDNADDGPGWRMGAFGTAQVAFVKIDGVRAQGFGGGFGLELERADFTSGLAAHGEWALGFYSAARRVNVDGLAPWTVAFGIEGRPPLAGL